MNNQNEYIYRIEELLYQKIHSKIYLICEIQNPIIKLTSRIYFDTNNNYFENEKNIFEIFQHTSNSNKYIIEKKSNIGKIMPNQKESFENQKYLIFKYYKNGELGEYLINQTTEISEIFVKLISYKLLQGIQYCHDCNISHNNLSLDNILFDDSFSPIIVDFSEAINLNNIFDLTSEEISNIKNKDFYNLAIIIINLFTDGKSEFFKRYKPNYKGKNYFIKENGKAIEESKFWKIIKNNSKKKISNDFIDFFMVLINPKKELNISFLINEFEWLKEFRDDFNLKKNEYVKNIELQLIKDFIKRYNYIMKLKTELDIFDKENIDFNDYLEPNIIKPKLLNYTISLGSNTNNNINNYKPETIYEQTFINNNQNYDINNINNNQNYIMGNINSLNINNMNNNYMNSINNINDDMYNVNSLHDNLANVNLNNLNNNKDNISSKKSHTCKKSYKYNKTNTINYNNTKQQKCNIDMSYYKKISDENLVQNNIFENNNQKNESYIDNGIKIKKIFERPNSIYNTCYYRIKLPKSKKNLTQIFMEVLLNEIKNSDINQALLLYDWKKDSLGFTLNYQNKNDEYLMEDEEDLFYDKETEECNKSIIDCELLELCNNLNDQKSQQYENLESEKTEYYLMFYNTFGTKFYFNKKFKSFRPLTIKVLKTIIYND